MKWINKVSHMPLKNIKAEIDKSKQLIKMEFKRKNNEVILVRLKILSIAMIVLYFYYLYSYFILARDLRNIYIVKNITGIHTLILILSIIYIMIYEIFAKREKFKASKYPNLIIRLYLTIILALGVFISIESQNHTGNIDAYTITILFVALIFPLEPIFMFCIFLVTHVIFISFLSLISPYDNLLIIKQINSTSVVIIAYSFVTIFYKHRSEDYYNKISLEKLFHVNPYPLIITRFKDGQIIKLNKKALVFYNLMPDEAKNMDAIDIYLHENQRAEIIEKLNKEGSVSNYILEDKRRNGLGRWVIANYELINYEGEKCILCGITDITELKSMELDLIKNATTDVLTGVLNRGTGIEILKTYLDKKTGELSEFTLCFIDINKLKQVNDTYGHSEGDYYISTVCKILKSAIKEDDVLFRYGGDEFIILFFNKHVDEIKEIWNNITLEFNQLNNSRYKPYDINVSYGMITYNSGMDITLEELIHLADKNMYRNKYSKRE